MPGGFVTVMPVRKENRFQQNILSGSLTTNFSGVKRLSSIQ